MKSKIGKHKVIGVVFAAIGLILVAGAVATSGLVSADNNFGSSDISTALILVGVICVLFAIGLFIYAISSQL
jgi:hypothetical protein